MKIIYCDTIASEPRWPGGFHQRAFSMMAPLLVVRRMVGPFIADNIDDWPEIRVIPYFDDVLKFGPKIRFRDEQMLLDALVGPNCVATFMRWGVEIVRARQEKLT